MTFADLLLAIMKMLCMKTGSDVYQSVIILSTIVVSLPFVPCVIM